MQSTQHSLQILHKLTGHIWNGGLCLSVHERSALSGVGFSDSTITSLQFESHENGLGVT